MKDEIGLYLDITTFVVGIRYEQRVENEKRREVVVYALARNLSQTDLQGVIFKARSQRLTVGNRTENDYQKIAAR